MSSTIDDLNNSIASLSMDTPNTPIARNTRTFLGANVINRYLSRESTPGTSHYSSQYRISPVAKYLRQARSTLVQSLWSGEDHLRPHTRQRDVATTGVSSRMHQDLVSDLSQELQDSKLCAPQSISPQTPLIVSPPRAKRVLELSPLVPRCEAVDAILGSEVAHVASTRGGAFVERLSFVETEVVDGNDAFVSADIESEHSTSHLLPREQLLEVIKVGSFSGGTVEVEVIDVDALDIPVMQSGSSSILPVPQHSAIHSHGNDNSEREIIDVDALDDSDILFMPRKTNITLPPSQQPGNSPISPSCNHDGHEVIDVDAFIASQPPPLLVMPESRTPKRVLRSQPILDRRSMAPSPEPRRVRGRSPMARHRKGRNHPIVQESRWQNWRLRSPSPSRIRHRIRSSRSRSPVVRRRDRSPEPRRRRRSISPPRYRGRGHSRDSLSRSPGGFWRSRSPDRRQSYRPRSRSRSPPRFWSDWVGRPERAELEAPPDPIYRSRSPADHRLLAIPLPKNGPQRWLSTDHAVLSVSKSCSKEIDSRSRAILGIVRAGIIVWFASDAKKFSATTRAPNCSMPPPIKRRPCLITKIVITPDGEVKVVLAPLGGALWSGRRKSAMYEDWWYPVSYIRNGKTIMSAPDDNLERTPLVIDIDPHVPIRFVSLKPSYLWVGDAGQAINIENIRDVRDTHMSISKDQVAKIERLHDYYAIANSPSSYPTLLESTVSPAIPNLLS